MTPELDRLLAELEPGTEDNLVDRLSFGLLCVGRVAHLLERAEVLGCLEALRGILANPLRMTEWPTLVERAAALANGHQGSPSLDGVGHAAVSASYACAKAIAGRSRQAAEYAAYAAVYGQGGYGATNDRSAFEPEYRWQARQLQALLASRQRAPSVG